MPSFVPALLLALFLSTSAAAGQAANRDAKPPDYPAWSQAAAKSLQQWYVPGSGLYRTTGWWNSANAITALANFSRENHTEKYFPVFANTLRAAQSWPHGARAFLNNYYDDEGWWALAWIDVYDLTRDPNYLRMADTIFTDMQAGWDTATCGGGVWWTKDKREKNAVENELFLSVAASLANRETDPSRRIADLEWAHKEWSWFLASGMINAQYLINDGVQSSGGGQCRNNGQNPWTYNQGVVLGGLVELDKADPDPQRRETANAIALAAISTLVDSQGVMHEANGAHTGGDVPQFKGIFVRNLMILNAALPDPRFQQFLRVNAHSLWNNDRDGANRFGFWWAGPVDQVDAGRQSAALDLLNAAEAVGSAKNGRTGTSAGNSEAKSPEAANQVQ